MRKERKGYGYVSTCGAIFSYTARSNLMSEKNIKYGVRPLKPFGTFGAWPEIQY